ncbi:50S ribosomal protein L17 [PVC group bacterium]|nr:50S ribosomal protein L17 [PVC group bacterium]
MRHRSLGYRIQVNSSHRRALISNLLASLFTHERIKTTILHAKALSREADKIITLAKRKNLHSRRLAAKKLRDKIALKKLFDDIQGRYDGRKGGYTRIIKLSGYRKGDGASLALIELTERRIVKEEKKEKEESAKNVKKIEEKPEKESFVKKVKNAVKKKAAAQ